MTANYPALDIDMTQIENLKMAFDGDITGFMESFFSDFEKKNQELAVFIQEKRGSDASIVAHTLKGNSANVGARGLSKLCAEIEEAAKNNDYETMLHTYEELKNLYPLFKSAFMDGKFTS